MTGLWGDSGRCARAWLKVRSGSIVSLEQRILEGENRPLNFRSPEADPDQYVLPAMTGLWGCCSKAAIGPAVLLQTGHPRRVRHLQLNFGCFAAIAAVGLGAL